VLFTTIYSLNLQTIPSFLFDNYNEEHPQNQHIQQIGFSIVDSNHSGFSLRIGYKA